jgi:phosphatidate cytidylyltransferase
VLRTRTLSAALLAPPVLAAIWLGLPGIAALLAVLAAAGGREVFGLLRGVGWPSMPTIGILLAVALVAEAAIAPGVELGLLVLAIGAIVAGIAAFARPDPRDGLLAWVATVSGAAYVGLLAFVLHLGSRAPGIPSGATLEALGPLRGWVVLLVLGVWSYDTGAYLVGRSIGRHRFLTHISPSKTIEGLVGGLVATTVVVALLLAGLGQAPLGALVLGPVLGLAAQAGDLAESMLKRAAGAKDSGTLIPGHGGVLDRTDSFLFAAPVVMVYVVALAR